MKNYLSPKVTTILFDSTDVLRTSGPDPVNLGINEIAPEVFY